MTKDEALKLALDLAIMHHTDDEYAGLRAKVHVAAKAALAQPAQEPVAWMHEWEDGERVPQLHPSDDRLNDQPTSVRPLVYGDTTPPQRPWVGLTDEEASWCQAPSTIQTWKRIEAKLKEKNT
jgi:hypothetical protein